MATKQHTHAGRESIVLIVDDRAENRKAIELILDDLGERLISVGSGGEALRTLLHEDVAVVLLDVQMPDIDGFETAQMIRARKKTQNTPIIFITGISQAEPDVRRGYSLGAVDYIFKPVVPEILRTKVAVFAELHRHRTDQVARLEQELAAERATVEALRGHTSPPAQLIDPDEGRKRALEHEYRQILAWYEPGSDARAECHDRLRALAQRIGEAGGGARDVMDLHVSVARQLDLKLPAARARQVRTRCRLITLELMGHLVEHYRRPLPG